MGEAEREVVDWVVEVTPEGEEDNVIVFVRRVEFRRLFRIWCSDPRASLKDRLPNRSFTLVFESSPACSQQGIICCADDQHWLYPPALLIL